MKWIYGKQDWKTLDRGQENCYMMTNGLGGFSATTMIGSVSRNDHAVLMACVKAPNHRYNMVHRLKEELYLLDEKVILSSQEFADGTREEGYEHLSSFTYKDTPVWKFHAKGIEIRKEIGMKQGENVVALQYQIANRSQKMCELVVTPFLQFVKKGSDLEASHKFKRNGNKIEKDGICLYFHTNGEVRTIPEQQENYYYSYDACDGRRKSGNAKAEHQISIQVAAGEIGVLEIIYEMDGSEPKQEFIKGHAQEIINGVKNNRKVWEDCAGFQSQLARFLSKSAAQFVSKRESTGGDTILAGFPFFEDWGRDTMIALPGICISTKQYETAKKILRTFASNERDGLMPNLFPEGENEPLYNTVDAALLFINCVYLYYEASKDIIFIKEMYPVMKRIMEAYQKGTKFGIHMDFDGLIIAGEGLSQVTWMDVRVGDILPTPRHGKPVEINAYWYNALCIMDTFEGILEIADHSYMELAKKVKNAFIHNFWMEKKGCLKDLVSATKADEQIRCNQIWAISMPFTMLQHEQEKRVVETVFEKLYTTYGLRTLEEADEEFHPYYKGEMKERDMAYHQGTIWTFPLGAYYLAYLKVNHYSEVAKTVVKEQMEVLESAMREGCIGQLPEIYDGKNPTSSKGCFAQAWSVGEILRVFEIIEK